MSATARFAKYVSQNIMGMLGISCYIIVDTFFIAKAAGANGITALNLVLPIYSLIFGVGAMFGIGSATKFALFRAEGDESASDYFSNALFFAGMLSLPIMLAGLLFPEQVLRIMGADPEIIALGTGYTRIALSFAPFFMWNHIISAFVRNDQGPTRAMIATMAGSIFNIIFDYILMFPMKMGYTGAALATAAAPVIGILICSTHFLKKDRTLFLRWKMPSIRKAIVAMKLGVGAFVGEISSGVTTAVFNFLILGIAGNTGVAAYGIVANFVIVVMSIFNGISQGSQPIISDFCGRGQDENVKKTLKLGIGTAVVAAGVIVAIVYLFTDPLIALFNSEGNQELAKYAYTGLRVYFLGFLVAGINVVLIGYYGAVSKAMEVFSLSICRGVIAIIVCAVVFSKLFGFLGIWISFGAAELITLGVAFMLYKNGRKR